ncbi:MAG: hypothetical protein K5854_05985 [Prevotella sp.]|nr:hypothetical protein [Prevotella sp.]
MNRKSHIYAMFLAVLLTAMSAVGCSTQKNTANARWWHAFNTRYNVYYNGAQAYIDGSLEKENGNQDNFTEMLPLYTVGNKKSKDLGHGNFERAIEKCEKAIQLHSIKKRPVWDKSRKKTAKDREWLSRREYNPFLWKAWLLMGRAQFHEGDFENAASTFAYMSRLYKTQPAIYGRAQAWLAKCFVEQDWLYDAEDVIRNIQRDSIHWRAKKEWDYTFADYYIHSGDYGKAIPYLKKVISHEMRRKQKAREWYLLGQIYKEMNMKAEAYKAFKHVVHLNPPYSLEFNARISMTEVMKAGSRNQIIRRLKRMAASDNNAEYLDQVYYAIGNTYLADRDTTNAILAYEKGNSKSTRSGIEKGVLLLKLGDLYWQIERYADAKRCYGEAIGLLDKERKDYEQLDMRSKVLDELVPHTEAVHLQDSLQSLATMSEKDRNNAIDKVIKALKDKEKAEAADAPNNDFGNDMSDNNFAKNTIPNDTKPKMQNGDGGAWYFYNPIAVSQGKAAFQRQWGKRANEDNWQRSNRTVVELSSAATPQQEEAAQPADSIPEKTAISNNEKTDSVASDPHTREYYLAQIPFTEEQIKASNKIIADGLYNSGVIFKDKLGNLPLSEKALRRLTDQYADYEHMDNAYYHLFLLYSLKGDHATAATYIDKLKADYPESKWTAILTDPYFEENAKFGVQIEDSLYASTYDAFRNDRLKEVAENVRISETRFPLGANRDKFIFIGGLGKLNDGNANGCLKDMQTVVSKYPESSVSPIAGMIINGVKAGRRLHGGNFNIDNILAQRSYVLNDSDTQAAKQFSAERNADFVYLMAYPADSVNENKLLYEWAKYNFTNYLVRSFDIDIIDEGALHRMQIGGFRNYDEVLQYARELNKHSKIANLLGGKGRTLIISTENLALLGISHSYDDYDKFYAKHFAPLKVSSLRLLDQPTEIVVKDFDETETQSPNDSKTDAEGGVYVVPTSPKQKSFDLEDEYYDLEGF